MDGFFAPPSASPGAQVPFVDPPPWTGRPHGAPLGTVIERRPLARSARARVEIAFLDAYPDGVELSIAVEVDVNWSDLTRPGEDMGPDVFGHQWPRTGGPPDELPGWLLRVGVRFADGRRATSIRGHDRPAEGPVLTQLGGGGSGGGPTSRFRQGFWITPLPPPGPFTVACEWPAFDIPLDGLELDGRAIRDAAARAGAMFSTDTVRRDGRDWRLGTAADVDWINAGTSPGMTITSSIPPVFDAYCTVVPRGDGGSAVPPPGPMPAIVEVLAAHTRVGPWWLGYLDTGASDVVFPYAPRTTVYYGYGYVVVAAGPAEASRWREPDGDGESLPDLIFPADRSWLLTTMWDDDWTCVGGGEGLVGAILAHPVLGGRARRVQLGEDSTPPGHVAF